MSSLGRELPKELAVALDPDSAELVVSFRPSHFVRVGAPRAAALPRAVEPVRADGGDDD